MSAETAKKIRNALKEAFPEFKFSVRKPDSLSLRVAVLSGPLDFSALKHSDINQYHLDMYRELGDEQYEFLKKVNDIIHSAGDYYDKSDMSSDYFNVAFYYSIRIGDYDKPYNQV